MSIVRFGGLLSKAVIASVIFLHVFSPTAMGMNWFFTQQSLNEPSVAQSEWNAEKEQINEWFSNQEYEKLFSRLSYFMQNELQEAFDWLTARVEKDHDIACSYELVRCYLKGNLFGEEDLFDMLALVILSLVQTKADVDACTMLTLKYWADRNPYDIIRVNYHYRLQSRKLVQQCDYTTILNRAKEMFEKMELHNLPLPIWIPTVDYGRTEYRVYFGNPKYLEMETSERAAWRKSYKFKNIIDEVRIIRRASFRNTWATLSKLTGWNEFFSLESCKYPELPVEEVSDLSASCMNLGATNNNHDHVDNNLENLVAQTQNLDLNNNSIDSSQGALDLSAQKDITKTMPWDSTIAVEKNETVPQTPVYDYIEVNGVRTPVLRRTPNNTNNANNNQ